MNIDLIIDQHRDPENRANALLQATQEWVNAGGERKTAQQAINDTLGMRAQEAQEDHDNTQHKSILTTLYLLNQWIVNKTVNTYAHDEDIKAAALLGLWIACQRFQPGKGSFYQYAQNYIKFEAAKAAADNRLETFYEWRNKPQVNQAIENLNNKTTPVTPETLSKETGLSKAVIKRILDPIRGVTPTKTNENGNEENILENIPSQDPHDNPETETINNDTRQQVLNIIKELTPEQQEVITRHYGLNGQHAQHLNQIAETLGWKKHNVTAIHREGLMALKASPAFSVLSVVRDF